MFWLTPNKNLTIIFSFGLLIAVSSGNFEKYREAFTEYPVSTMPKTLPCSIPVADNSISTNQVDHKGLVGLPGPTLHKSFNVISLQNPWKGFFFFCQIVFLLTLNRIWREFLFDEYDFSRTWITWVISEFLGYWQDL